MARNNNHSVQVIQDGRVVEDWEFEDEDGAKNYLEHIRQNNETYSGRRVDAALYSDKGQTVVENFSDDDDMYGSRNGRRR